MKPSHLKLACLLMAALLAGCSSTSTAHHFYLLTPLESVDHGANVPSPISLLVARVEVPQYLNRPQIVTQSGPNQVDMAEFQLWGDNFQKNITRVLAENLARLWPTERVFVAPTHTLAHDFRIEVEIIRFEQDSDQTVRLKARWRIHWGEKGHGIEAHASELTSATVATGDYPAIVAAMSGLLGDLSRNIVAELRRLTPSPAKPGA